LAAVTKYSQAKEVYDANIVEVAAVTAKEAKKCGVKRFIQVSTAQVYKTKKPAKEDQKLEPWTAIAVAHVEAEKKIKESGIDYIIVRPALCYGTADQLSLTPRLIIGSIHKEEKKKWNASIPKTLGLTLFMQMMLLKLFIFSVLTETLVMSTILQIKMILIKERLMIF
jgi:nucleoside-diphosphate-sugar epimerase